MVEIVGARAEIEPMFATAPLIARSALSVWQTVRFSQIPVLTLRLLAACALGLGPVYAASERFFVHWRAADEKHPWLSDVSARAMEPGLTMETRRLPLEPSLETEYPNGMEVILTSPDRPMEQRPSWIQLRLAQGYGFTFSDEMLAEHPYLWVRDLGIYISRGNWGDTALARVDAEARIKRSMTLPFESTAERYFNWTGFTEHEPDDIHRHVWEFITAKRLWPPEARVADRIAAMPEVDAAYFSARIPDLKFSRMYLGWAGHNDQFTLWNHGRLGVSSQSVGGNPTLKEIPWHPRAAGYTFQFGVAGGGRAFPRFREPGDESVRQRLEDGHNLIVVTEWTEDEVGIEQTNFASPLDGTKITTGLEPLLCWTKLTLSNRSTATGHAYLGIEFTDYDYVTFVPPNPIAGFGHLEWRDGAFRVGERVLAVSDPALAFEELPTRDGRKRFRAHVTLAGAQTRSFSFAHFYRAGMPGQISDVKSAYQVAHGRTLRFWNELAARGASIRVPDDLLNHLFRTFLPRITLNAHPDPTGMTVMHTGPIAYARVWHHITAGGIGGDLVRRGQFELARRYFEALFAWQNIPAPDSPAITDWRGFFGAPPEQCAKVWINSHGKVLWAAARYVQFSGDRVWLEEKLPALLAAMEWVARGRQATMKLNPDGTRPLNYGWFPPGRVSDGMSGTSVFSDTNLWFGLAAMTRVLEETGHPRASEFRVAADDYRRCIQDGERRAAAERPLMRLNDATWVPYLPAFLDSAGDERSGKVKYVNVVDAAWAWGMLDTQVFPPGSPENQWLVHMIEDAYSAITPGLPDEPFCIGTMNEYLHQDRIANYLYAFYSQSTNAMSRQTLTTYEHRSWGQKREFELTPWAAGYWTTNFTNLLCRTVGRELWLLQATPRRWLADGQAIEVRNLQTEFGPITFSVRSKLTENLIEADVEPPSRTVANKLRVRLRVPVGRALRSVTVNGEQWTEFDPAGEWVFLPAGEKRIRVVARY